GVKITGNSAWSGGGIHFDIRTISDYDISNSEISNNTALAFGGGIFSTARNKYKIADSKINGNTAGSSGGGLCNGTFTESQITNSEINGNAASYHGGGVYNAIDSIVEITNSEISGNTARYNGGGLFNDYGLATISGVKISGNNATTGGGIFTNGLIDNSYSITNSEITGNIAIGNGGGIYSPVSMNNQFNITGDVVFSDNEAATAYDYGINNKSNYPNLNWSGKGSISGTHIMNNYDMFYDEGDLIEFFMVTFLDKDGNELTTEKVKSGENATAPLAPYEIGWAFDKWSEDFTYINKNTTIQALYSRVHTVKFVDWNDTLLKTEIVIHGNNATAPANPTRSGYTFEGWLGAFTNVTEDTTVIAQYHKISGSESSNPDPEPGTNPEPRTDPETEPEQETEPVTEPETEPDTEPETESTPETKPGYTPEQGVESEQEPAYGINNEIPPVTEGYLIQDGDIYLEIDGNGNPLGKWHRDSETGEWIFTEYPTQPLAFMPQTGDNGALTFSFMMLCLSLIGFGLILRFKRRYRF
ncbi:MAG: InlB B-repeat-containing protein, partial [Peptococcaceae bacterium]|nr:InlB B-repeat-containing protein [Peptococcaceae bacterium]